MPTGLVCSFCNKRSEDVLRLIAGPPVKKKESVNGKGFDAKLTISTTAFICDECVLVCVEICVDSFQENLAKPNVVLEELSKKFMKFARCLQDTAAKIDLKNCRDCGGVMVKDGALYRCPNCHCTDPIS